MEEFEYCNRCGQEIDLIEYESNIYGFCEECLADKEEEDYLEGKESYDNE